MKTTGKKFDLYQTVTDQIVAALTKGVRPWVAPWKSGSDRVSLPLNFEGKPYNGINVCLLWGASMERGYTNPTWMSFRQAVNLGGHVRKGEKGTMIVFSKPHKRMVEDEKTGERVEKLTFIMRYFYVFNVEQIEDLPERFHPKPVEGANDESSKRMERIARADAYLNSLQATVRHGGHSAFYCPSDDHIQLPEFASFNTAEDYYATSAHEHIHWTGVEKRLNRQFGKRFGDEAYAAEELVAEMGSAFLCAALGIEMTPREDHASYLSHWIKVLKQDKHAIFTAATAAKKAVEYLNSLAGVDAIQANDNRPAENPTIGEDEEQEAA